MQRVSPYWNPSELDLHRDIQLSLSNSSDYLRKCLTNHGTDPDNTNFSPAHRHRGDLDDFLSSDGAFFEKAYRAEPHVSLYDVERAVEGEIDDWVDLVMENGGACVQLEILANKYSSGALKTYGKNPESPSVMLLTMVELWVALDKIAIKDIPMLADYSPEVPISILEDLLVCKAASFDRLRHIHQYISRRHSQSHRGSVFSDTVNADTFAVRYYRGSSCLQSLKSRIEDVARREVRDKIVELKKENARYAELQRQADRIEHTYNTDWLGHTCHSRDCSKCNLEDQQRRLRIAVHEWPLPAEQLQAEVVVFELDCPVSFNMWRTATFHLLVDLCSPSQEPHGPYTKLHTYDSLRPYLVSCTRSRISLASDAKPFVVSHYRTMSIPSIEKAVCVSNGLKFYGYDGHARVLTSEALGRFSTHKYCTYQIQSGPYYNLQKYLDTTSHASNQVIANQVDCHVDLSLHEYLAFGHLRSGGAIQWLNILHGLRGRSLRFRRYEVHFLMAQAVSQVGLLASTGWAWHQDLQQPSFCYALLGELETLLRDIEGNWLEGVTMDTISFLLRRLLSSSPDQAVSLRALELPRTLRGKVFTWVEELSAKLTETPGDEPLGVFLRDSAAICRSTFDVDPDLMHSVLSSAEDVDILLSSAILIHDHTPSKVSCPYSQLLLDRDRRLSLALEDALRDLIQADSNDEGIDRAIRRIWHDYRPGSVWTPLYIPNSRWVSCTTASTTDQDSQQVHLNLLDGSLLVDGKPLGRLPAQILRHPLYNLIFGKVRLAVPRVTQVTDYFCSKCLMLSQAISQGWITQRGVKFRVIRSAHLNGWGCNMTKRHTQVYFSLRNGSDLVIKAKRKQAGNVDSEFIVLIPQEIMQKDFPAVLVEEHAHWLSLSTSVLEICPLDTIWKTSPENWKIDCIPGKYRMHRGHELLIDIRSPSWTMVSDLLKPLDTARNLLVSVLPIDSGPQSLQLSVALPRYGLSFYVDGDGQLQSRNIRGMVYDENQCIGTMFGLVNRLILRPKIRDVDVVDLTPRCVIIPEGKISFRKSSHHARVEISTPHSALDRIAYQTYRVDTDLGCLATVGLTNKLYCAYLHALTSGCSTDLLTGRTGTEEALSLLWSACCWSIMKFSSRDAELLGLIASICPSRTWYPKHLKYMQQVQWLDLPTNSQHHELYVVTSAIKAHYDRLQSFHENTPDKPFQAFPSREDHLLERSARRAVYLSPSDSSWEPSGTSRGDIWYRSRDLMKNDSGEHRAYAAATTVYNRTANATITKDILSMVESWTDVSGNATLSLQYDRSWLVPKLPSIWLEAYNLLRRSGEVEWFQLLFTLPAMAYASPELSDLVPVLVAFASHPRAFENPPCYNSYTLSDKYYPSQATLHSYVSHSAYSIKSSPESSEPARHNEDPK